MSSWSVSRRLWRRLSKLLWLLVLVSVVSGIAVADITDLLDTDIPKQKMVMGKAGLGNVAPEPVPVAKKQPGSSVEDKADRLVARVENRLSFPAQKIYQWAAQVVQESLSYSGRHRVRDMQHVARYYSADAWPKLQKALFSDRDSPLLQVDNQQVDSSAVLLDMPRLMHTEQWEQFTVWVVKVPVMVMVYTQQPQKYIFDALFAINVQGGTEQMPEFLVQKALLQSRDKR